MGGINHQPTSQISIALSVPAAGALSKAQSELMLGNCSIEELIQLTQTTHFGVGRQKLIQARMHFEMGVSELHEVKSYVDRITDMIGNPDYQPFDLSDINAAELIEQCIAAGLLPDSIEVRNAITVTTTAGYQGIFFEIGDRLVKAIAKLEALCETTDPMVEGPEGTQGYFWQNVEGNRTSWRSDYMSALTAMTNLISFWSATAAICTEVHHHNTKTGSLLTHTHASATIG